MNEDEERIRAEAHKLWEAEGRPDGRAARHWAEAREIVALKDSMGTTLKPVEDTIDEPAEEVVAAENLGDLPGMTDQGDETLAPSRKAAKALADEPPLVTDEQKAVPPKGKAGASAGKAKDGAEKAKSKGSSAKTKADDKEPAKRKSKSA